MANVIYQGDLLPKLVFTAVDESGNAIDLTDATCKVLFGPIPPLSASGFVGGGTCTIDTNVCTYQLAASDTNTAGSWFVQLYATWSGSIPQHFGPLKVVIAAPVYIWS